MATPQSSLSALFKEVYSKKGLLNLIPEAAKLLGEIPFEERARIGNKYHHPVVIQEESGFTHSAAGAGAFTLQPSSTMATQDAQLDGSQIVLAATIDYEVAARSQTSQAAFTEVTQLQVKNMQMSMRTRLESILWHGQMGLGKSSSATVSSADLAVVFTAASFAEGIWVGRKGHSVVFYNGTTQLVSGHAFTVKAVDISARKVTFTETTGGDASTVNTAMGSNSCDAYWFSAVSGTGGSMAFAEAAGVLAFVSNTSGTVANISAATYDLWAGNVYDCASKPLTVSTMLDGLSLPMARGLNGQASLWVSLKTFGNLVADRDALVRYGGGEKRLASGARAITLTLGAVDLDIIPHAMIKGGDAVVLKHGEIKRIGATDVSFERPGAGGEIFIDLQTKAGFEYRCYSHQAVLVEAPSHTLLFKNIANV